MNPRNPGVARDVDTRLLSSLRAAGRVLPVVPLTVAILGLIGWWFDVVPLRQVQTHWVPIVPNAAFSLILAALALALMEMPRAQRAIRGIGGLLAFFGLTRILEVASIVDLHPAHLLISRSLVEPQMPLATAMVLILLGVALAEGAREEAGATARAQRLAVGNILIGLFGLIGYLSGTAAHTIDDFSTMSFHVAVCSVLLGLALLLRTPTVGITRACVSRGPSALIFRRLAAGALLIPTALAVLVLFAIDARRVSVELGITTLAMASATAFLVLASESTRNATRSHSDTNRLTRRLGEVDRKLASEKVLNALTDSISDGIVSTDPSGLIRRWSRGAASMFGFAEIEMIGSSVFRLLPREGRSAQFSRLREGMRANEAVPTTLDFRLRRKDGSEFPCEVSVSVIRAPDRIYTAVIRDVTERRLATEALAASEARLRTLIAVAPVGIFETDTAGGCVDVNARWSEITGLSRSDALGDAWAATLHPEDRALVFDAWTAAAKEQREFRLDYRFQNKGSDLWVAGTATSMRDADGEVRGYLGTIIDITERVNLNSQLRLALAEKETLLKEVHHRVKNNLQIISSVLKLHAARVGDDAAKLALTDTQDRVRAIAELHETLYRSKDLGRVNLLSYARALVQTLARAHGATLGAALSVQGDAIELPIDRAVPAGLILTELTSNALKHAFRSRSAEAPKVSIVLAGIGAEIEMKVRDNGIGIPDNFDLASFHSLGLHLSRSLSRQLGGTLTAWNDNGAVFAVRFYATASEVAS